MSIRETRNDSHFVEALDAARAHVAAGQRRLFSSVAACDRAEVWRADGCRDMAQWLAGRLGISTWTARRWVTAAHALEALPAVAAAFEAGTLSVEKVVELCRFATPETEQALIRWAQRAPPAAVRRRADLAGRPDIEEARDAHRGRYLRGWWEDDGRYGIEGWFPADQGVVIDRILDRIAGRIPELPEDATYPDGTPRSYGDRVDSRRADALFLMASREMSADPDPDRANLVVHAPLDALVGGHSGCEIEGGPVVHPEVAARLACDPRLQVVLRDRTGRPVGVGWTSRNPPRWLMRALRYRDRCCTFPGCDFRRFVHAHHIVKWPVGPTELDNLTLVCPFHHKLLHEFGWRVELREAGGTRWFRPDGRTYDPTGPPVPGRTDPTATVQSGDAA